MTTSPTHIRVLRPEYTTESTARQLEDDYATSLGSQPDQYDNETDAEARTRRDQLKVISGQLKRAPIGYSIFVLAIPIIALVVVLVVNIVVSNRQYELVDLSSQLTTITQSNEALAQELSQKSAPQSVAQQAADMGMVLPGATASIDLTAGKVIGIATAAEADNTPTSFVAKPTVRSSTGVPTAVEGPVRSAADPVTVTNEEVPGPKSNTVKILEPQISLPAPDATQSTPVQGVADTIHTASLGSLQGPQVSLPSDN